MKSRLELLAKSVIFLTSFLVLLGALLLWSQHESCNLTGTVTDEHNEPLNGALVEVQNELTGTVESYVTDKTGQYNFPYLLGYLDYTLWATWHGHRSSIKKLSLFNGHPARVVDFRIVEERCTRTISLLGKWWKELG